MLNGTGAAAAALLTMRTDPCTPNDKPYDIHERLLDFACGVVGVAQYLHQRGPIARALSYQILSA